MKNIQVPPDNNARRNLFTDALLAAFQFNVEQDDGKFKRAAVTSFSSVLIKCLTSQSARWTIVLKEKVFEGEIEYYEFGVALTVTYPYLYIWIKVSVEESKEIFKEYKLNEK